MAAENLKICKFRKLEIWKSRALGLKNCKFGNLEISCKFGNGGFKTEQRWIRGGPSYKTKPYIYIYICIYICIYMYMYKCLLELNLDFFVLYCWPVGVLWGATGAQGA